MPIERFVLRNSLFAISFIVKIILHNLLFIK